MKNGRCRLHGGLSTGPKTFAGRQRIREAQLKHGDYARATVEKRRNASREARELMRAARELFGR